MVPSTVWRVGVRHIWDAQENFAECSLYGFNFGLKDSFSLAMCTATFLKSLSFRNLLIATKHSHLLGQVIDLSTDGITLRGNLAKAGIECNGFINLTQNVWLASTSQSSPDPL
jgi:hypothetical protein